MAEKSSMGLSSGMAPLATRKALRAQRKEENSSQGFSNADYLRDVARRDAGLPAQEAAPANAAKVAATALPAETAATGLDGTAKAPAVPVAPSPPAPTAAGWGGVVSGQPAKPKGRANK